MRPHLRLRRPQRGFTTLEAIIALVLLAIVLILGLRIVGSWAAASQQQLARIDLSRDRQLTLATLADDLATIRTCEPERLGAPFRTFAGDQIAFYADPDGNGTIDLITYSADGGQLERAQATQVDPGCDPASFSTATTETLLSNTTATLDVDDDGDGDVVFRGWRDGQPASGDETHDCAGQQTSSTDCLYDLLEIGLTTSGGASTRLQVHRTYPIDTGWSRVTARG